MSDQDLKQSHMMSRYGKSSTKVRFIFKILLRTVALSMILCMLYWVWATDRYVSEATIIIQNTQNSIASSINLGSLLGLGQTASSPDQLLLLEHLRSVDMLKKLDHTLDLRSHYSKSHADIFSVMWDVNAPSEEFYEYFQNKASIRFDDFSGVLRIKAQAFTPRMAQDIAHMIVKEGETYMNKLSHQLAQGQVNFLEEQVSSAYAHVLKASDALIKYQNKEGLASPSAAADSVFTIISGLETQRTELATQLAALPHSLVQDHPTKIMLRQSLAAIEKQITEEKSRLASISGRSLNTLIAEYDRLQMELNFKKEIYKTALVALEAGRMEASRTIKQVSVLQYPPLPEYPLEPRRFYNACATLLVGLLLLGMIKLLESIILDHVD